MIAFIMKHITLRKICYFLMLKLFVALINISSPPPPFLTSLSSTNALNVVTGLIMLQQTNRVYGVSESEFPSFFGQTNGGVVADRVQIEFKPIDC